MGSGACWTTTGRSRTRSGLPTPEPDINRNGNLQVAQFYSGVVQPSIAAAAAAGSLFYGAAQNTGVMSSDPGILTTGDLQWTQAQETEDGVDRQRTGRARSAPRAWAPISRVRARSYSYTFPFAGAAYLNFVQV